jgi:hypothetical protein
MTDGWPPDPRARPGPADPTQRSPAQRSDDVTRRTDSSDYATGRADALAWSQDESPRTESYSDPTQVVPRWPDAGDDVAPAKQWYQGWPIYLAAAGAVAVLAAGAGLAYTLTSNSTPSSPSSIPDPPSSAIPVLSSTAPSSEVPTDTPPNGNASTPEQGGSNSGQGGTNPEQGGTVTISSTTTVPATVTSTVTSPTLTSTVTSTVATPTVTTTITVVVKGPPTTVTKPR